jgi:catechol-2,3-dioxygenase
MRRSLLLLTAIGAITFASSAYGKDNQSAAIASPGGQIVGAFIALSAKDARGMADWYRSKLGFRTMLERDIPERKIVAILLAREGSIVEIIQRADTRPAPTREDGKRSAIEIQGVFKVGLTVEKLQQLHDVLAAAGVEFDYHIVQPDGNRWRTFAVRDPEGNIVQFFGR